MSRLDLWSGDQYSTMWTVVDFHKINLDLHGLSWIGILNLMDFVAIQWTIWDYHGFAKDCFDVHGLSWICMLNSMDLAVIQWTICGMLLVCKRLFRCTWTVMDL